MIDAEPTEFEGINGEEELREAIQKGIDDIAAGRFTTINNEEELRAFFGDL